MGILRLFPTDADLIVSSELENLRGKVKVLLERVCKVLLGYFIGTKLSLQLLQGDTSP